MTPSKEEVEEALKWAETPLPDWLNTLGPNYQEQVRECGMRKALASALRAAESEIKTHEAYFGTEAERRHQWDTMTYRLKTLEEENARMRALVARAEDWAFQTAEFRLLLRAMNSALKQEAE